MTAGKYVLVQRNTPGSAVSARTDGSKVPTVHILSDRQTEFKIVNEQELTKLLASRQPFDPVAVTPQLAEQVLGWSLLNDEGESHS